MELASIITSSAHRLVSEEGVTSELSPADRSSCRSVQAGRRAAWRLEVVFESVGLHSALSLSCGIFKTLITSA